MATEKKWWVGAEELEWTLSALSDVAGGELTRRHSDFLWSVCPVATGVLHCPGQAGRAPPPVAPTPVLTGHITRRCHSHAHSAPDLTHFSQSTPRPPLSPSSSSSSFGSGQSALTPRNLSWALIKAFRGGVSITDIVTDSRLMLGEITQMRGGGEGGKLRWQTSWARSPSLTTRRWPCVFRSSASSAHMAAGLPRHPSNFRS